nr:uncharacterized protein LOC112546384 isoform X2 [Pelodiscus sinensis]|eukprot:XP_025042326.1 uncharacterized protein LOC112546384 isoform X2 [Pelodiscus sinensis]
MGWPHQDFGYKKKRTEEEVAINYCCTNLVYGGEAINTILLCRIIHLGNMDPHITRFAAMGFPNCRGGGIGSTHIPIQAPDPQAPNYIRHKEYFSMALQAPMDHQGWLTNINIEWSGKVHDAQVFRSSSLYEKMHIVTFFPDHIIRFGDIDMPMCMGRTQPTLCSPG